MLTDKERLALIESLVSIEDFGDHKTVKIEFHNFAWLMELAEKAEELETQVKILKDVIEDETRRKNAIAKDWSKVVDERNALKEKVEELEKTVKEQVQNNYCIICGDTGKEVINGAVYCVECKNNLLL